MMAQQYRKPQLEKANPRLQEADLQEIPPPPKSAIANHYQSAPMSAKNANKDGILSSRGKLFGIPNQSSINLSNVRSADEISNQSIEDSDMNPLQTRG